MKTFKQYMELMEAKKMSKNASEKLQRIECEDCERIYQIPKAEYDREVKRTGKWKQHPDEDCPYCRHENDMDDPMPGQRRARYGDHTGIAEGKKKEYAPLVGARPDNTLPSGAQPMIPDEFPQKTVVTEKRNPKGKMMKLE